MTGQGPQAAASSSGLFFHLLAAPMLAVGWNGILVHGGLLRGVP